MATNYTTKTAALRATRADMRQVAVNKKIEIGSVAKDENGLPTSGTAVDSKYISTDTLYVTDTRDGFDTSGKRTDVMEILGTMKNGIDIGTETSESIEDDPDSGVTDAPAAYTGVSKLNFRGDYVTVVEDPVTKEITLWLNKSTAYPEYKSTVRTSGTNPTTTNYTVYTNDTDTFAIGTPGGTKATYVVDDNSNFGSSTYILKSAADTGANTTGGLTFRVSSTQALFIRQVYEGVSSAWQKIDFSVDAGKSYDVSKAYADKSSNPFTSGSAKTGTKDGITLTYSVKKLTTEHAPNGRVPGTSEAQVQLAINWDTVLTKDGGTASFQIAFDSNTKSAPADGNIVNLVNAVFFSERKAPSCSVPVISVTTPDYADNKVSGLQYLGAGTKVSVSVETISNTQWKTSNTTGNRITLSAANGTAKTFIKGNATSATEGEFRINDTTKINHSNAVYSVHNHVLTTGSEGSSNMGKLIVTATPNGAKNGTPQTATINGYWESLPTSTALVENFGGETTALGGFRQLTHSDAPGSYDNTKAVNTLSATVNGTATVPAVCQYGKLVHPSKADVDGEGNKPYADVTTPASFIRTFTGSAGTNFFTLSGTGLTGSGVSVSWYDQKNSIWRPLTINGVAADDSTTVTTGTIKRAINTGAQEEKAATHIIGIVMTKDAGAISPVTLTKSN